MNQKGVIALVAPFLLLLIIAAAVFLLIYIGVIKNPAPSIIKITPKGKEPTVSLQTQYQNPFDKNAQYTNPFAGYKNPFDSLK